MGGAQDISNAASYHGVIALPAWLLQLCK